MDWADPAQARGAVMRMLREVTKSSVTAAKALLIRGDTSVADIYGGVPPAAQPFLFRHVANRTAEDGSSDPDTRFLDPTDVWVAGHYRAQNYRSMRRALFGVAP